MRRCGGRFPRRTGDHVPGTITEENWTWRMPLSIETLPDRVILSERLRALDRNRAARPVQRSA